jgi:hypothetical protein
MGNKLTKQEGADRCLGWVQHSRNKTYPSWTWASIDGTVNYRLNASRITWVPVDINFDVQISDKAQTSVTGSLTLKSTIVKFPKNIKFWRYRNIFYSPPGGLRSRRGGVSKDYPSTMGSIQRVSKTCLIEKVDIVAFFHKGLRIWDAAVVQMR